MWPCSEPSASDCQAMRCARYLGAELGLRYPEERGRAWGGHQAYERWCDLLERQNEICGAAADDGLCHLWVSARALVLGDDHAALLCDLAGALRAIRVRPGQDDGQGPVSKYARQ